MDILPLFHFAGHSKCFSPRRRKKTYCKYSHFSVIISDNICSKINYATCFAYSSGEKPIEKFQKGETELSQSRPIKFITASLGFLLVRGVMLTILWLAPTVYGLASMGHGTESDTCRSQSGVKVSNVV